MEFEDVKESQYSFVEIYDAIEVKPLFHQFLQDTHVTEILNFLEQVEDFKKLKSSSNRKRKAEKIIINFIKPKAEQELNISVNCRNEILNIFEKTLHKEAFFQTNIFNSAEELLYDDLRFDVFPRFVKTSNFQKLMKAEFQTLGCENFSKKYLKSEEIEIEEKQNEYKGFIKRKNPEEGNSLKEGLPTFNLLFETTKEEEDNLFKGFVEDEFKKGFLHELLCEMASPINGVKLSISKNFLFASKKKKKEFLGENALVWIKEYIGEADETSIVEYLNFIIKRNLIIPSNTKNTSFSLKETYSFGFKKRVVIVGMFFIVIFSKGLVTLECFQQKFSEMILKLQ
jgi:hypothetical protein